MKAKKILSAFLALALTLCLSTPALAAEAPVQQPSPWSYEYMTDGYALGLVDDNMGQYILSPVTQERLDAMIAAAAAKLALLELPQRTATDEPLVVDLTRGGVMNALYQICADYELDGIEDGPIPFLTRLGVVCGINKAGDLDLERACTCQEAMVMTVRLVLAVYDQSDAGSHGLLWKATNGGNTLYLLGTAHMDRGNIYPFHRSLRAALASAQEVIFELDLNDQEGIAQLAAMQSYTDGTTLKDHISAELYDQTVELVSSLTGLPEETIASLKPWALATSLTSLLTQDESTGDAPLAIDLYLNSAAVYQGKTIGAVETYAFQGGIFDTLSPEYQEAYLASSVALCLAANGETPDLSEEEQQAVQEALELQNQMLDAMIDAWKAGDAEAFGLVYNKAAIVNSDDELNSRLFTDRDPNMIKYAAQLLEREGENIFFLAVGAGHMVDPGGIVSGLRALGYTVEPA
ncbi:MAG: TraB/GumN family protein [Oscillospiraceae bacterium]|nr:TraB/GumN family protein [Oscillospiraceae bacterium]